MRIAKQCYSHDREVCIPCDPLWRFDLAYAISVTTLGSIDMAFSGYSLRAHKKVLQTKNQTIFKNLPSRTQLSPDPLILHGSVVDVGDWVWKEVNQGDC